VSYGQIVFQPTPSADAEGDTDEELQLAEGKLFQPTPSADAEGD